MHISSKSHSWVPTMAIPVWLWNSILPKPGQPIVQLSKLIRLTACKKVIHAMSQWLGQFISLG